MSSSLSPVPLVPVPIPDSVAVLIGRQMPKPVLEAEIAAESAAYCIRLCRGPQYREAREAALAELHRQNKLLAAYNPGLIVKAGDRS